jgi:hypothetical protein
LVRNVDDLLEICIAARGRGMDFPTLWNSILKPSRLVVGNPVQVHENGQPTLKIRLVTSQYLAFAANKFALESISAQRLVSPSRRPRNAA